MQFDQILSNCVQFNIFRTNYYCMKFDNLFYCSLKFKMNKEINKIIEIYFTYLKNKHNVLLFYYFLAFLLFNLQIIYLINY